MRRSKEAARIGACCPGQTSLPFHPSAGTMSRSASCHSLRHASTLRMRQPARNGVVEVSIPMPCAGGLRSLLLRLGRSSREGGGRGQKRPGQRKTFFGGRRPACRCSSLTAGRAKARGGGRGRPTRPQAEAAGRARRQPRRRKMEHERTKGRTAQRQLTQAPPTTLHFALSVI
jgi:hypothetical protein